MAKTTNTIEVNVTANDQASAVMKSLGGALTGIVSIGFATKVAEMGLELAQLGAQASRAETVFTNISGGAQAATANLDAMRNATGGALSDMEAMQQAARLLQMGLVEDSAGLEQFTEMATRLGTAMGRDVSQSIEEFSLLMANQSLRRLDTFGISAARVLVRMEELAAANSNLTREQRFNIAVMEEGTAAMERLGPALEDGVSETQRLAAQFENLKANVGQMLEPALVSVTGLLADLTTEIVNQQNAMEALRDANADATINSQDLQKNWEENLGTVDAYANAYGTLNDAVAASPEQINAAYRESMLLAQGMAEGQHQVGMTAREMQHLVETTGRLRLDSIDSAMRAAIPSVANLAREIGGLNAALAELQSRREIRINITEQITRARTTIEGERGIAREERASGGPVDAGQPYLVGERGTELFIPAQSGRIISAGETARIMNDNRRTIGGDTFNVTVNDRGAANLLLAMVEDRRAGRLNTSSGFGGL